MNGISIIDSKKLQFLENKNEYIFVNFAYPYAIKINFYYETIKKSGRNKLIKLFNQLTGVEIRTNDTLGKLHIILLKLLIDGEKDNIVISSIAFHMVSFEFLIDNFKKIFQNLDGLENKNIIILECNLNNPEDIKNMDQYLR